MSFIGFFFHFFTQGSICGKINTDSELVFSEKISMSKIYKNTSTVVQLSPEENRLLTESAERSGRTKLQEASIRLKDHLHNFSDIATLGKRFEQTQQE